MTKTEYGWVIEHGQSEVSAPEYWAGGECYDGGIFENDWQLDHLAAIRFAREVDARRVAQALVDPEPYRICEHAWD